MKQFRPFPLVLFVAVALLASACSGSTFGSNGRNGRRLAAGSGDVSNLPALPNRDDGTGSLSPLYAAAVVSPSNGIATSLSPTMSRRCPA